VNHGEIDHTLLLLQQHSTISLSFSAARKPTAAAASSVGLGDAVAHLLRLVEIVRVGSEEWLTRTYPHCTVKVWVAPRPPESVCMRADELHVNYLELGSSYLLLHRSVQVTRSDLSFLYRQAAFFRVALPVPPLCAVRTLLFTLAALSDERRLAANYDIELVQLAIEQVPPSAAANALPRTQSEPIGNIEKQQPQQLQPAAAPPSSFSAVSLEDMERATELYGEPAAMSPYDPRFKKRQGAVPASTRSEQ